MPADPADAPQLKALTVDPAHVTLTDGRRSAQLKIQATMSDGSARDVTSLTVFESSDPSIEIQPDGTITFPESSASRQTSVTARYLNQQTSVRLEYVPPRSDFVFTSPPVANVIDEVVFSQLRRLQINPSPLCDDITFLRRVFLDLTGRLPHTAEAQSFLSAPASDRRARLIDHLLESPEFVDTQTLRWADLLRVEEKTLDRKGVQVFHQWIRQHVAEDTPLPEFAAAILGARGSTYSDPPTNFYRALRTPEERSESAAQVFLGVRLQCAKCHNHPFDRWTQDDYYGWTNYFARVDYKILDNFRRDENDKHEFDGEQIVFLKRSGDIRHPSTGRPAVLRLLGTGSPRNGPDSDAAQRSDERDRLQQLADWIADPGNHRFAATQANRIWFQLTGRGVVDPIDDFRSTNPPSNPALLHELTQQFVAGGGRVRPLMRLILNSSTYQLSSEPNSTNANDEQLFSHVIPRRLTAEQLLDAISQALDIDVEFGGQPEGTRAGQLAGIRHSGLRSSRPAAGDRFLAMFGKPARLQTCECERTPDTSLAQTLELLNGPLLTELLERNDHRLARAMNSSATTPEILRDFFLAALSREPAADELSRLTDYVARHEDRRAALQDIAWAVLNSNEFLLRR
jgi:hypothetical protein